MALFYFRITHDGRASSPSALDFPDRKAAWQEATHTAGQMLRDLNGDLQPGAEWRIEISDSARKPILSLHFIAEKHD